MTSTERIFFVSLNAKYGWRMFENFGLSSRSSFEQKTTLTSDANRQTIEAGGTRAEITRSYEIKNNVKTAMDIKNAGILFTTYENIRAFQAESAKANSLTQSMTLEYEHPFLNVRSIGDILSLVGYQYDNVNDLVGTGDKSVHSFFLRGLWDIRVPYWKIFTGYKHSLEDFTNTLKRSSVNELELQLIRDVLPWEATIVGGYIVRWHEDDGTKQTISLSINKSLSQKLFVNARADYTHNEIDIAGVNVGDFDEGSLGTTWNYRIDNQWNVIYQNGFQHRFSDDFFDSTDNSLEVAYQFKVRMPQWKDGQKQKQITNNRIVAGYRFRQFINDERDDHDFHLAFVALELFF